MIRRDTIGEIVQSHHRKAIRAYPRCGEILQHRQQNHAAADGIDDLQEVEVIGEK